MITVPNGAPPPPLAYCPHESRLINGAYHRIAKNVLTHRRRAPTVICMTTGYRPAALRTDRVREIATAHRDERGALLPVLHAVQDELGFIDAVDLPVIADVLNFSLAEVHGVVTFYRDFRRTPGGRTAVRICRAEACQAVGAEALAAHARRRLGVGFGATTHDGAVTLDEVFCLGNCALGPAVQVDGRLHGRVNPARFDALLGEVAP
jgi:formate dehydrogenase subunit gamma